MSPNISTIVSDIDRYVAHDADAVTVTPISYLLPLPKELELYKPVILQLGRQFTPPFLQNSGIAVTYSRIPMDPPCVVADFLACHEKRILLQPLPALLTKGIEGTTVVLSSVRKESRSSSV